MNALEPRWYYRCERGHRSSTTDPTMERCTAAVGVDGVTPSFSADAFAVCGAEFDDDSPWMPHWMLAESGLLRPEWATDEAKAVLDAAVARHVALHATFARGDEAAFSEWARQHAATTVRYHEALDAYIASFSDVAARASDDGSSRAERVSPAPRRKEGT